MDLLVHHRFTAIRCRLRSSTRQPIRCRLLAIVEPTIALPMAASGQRYLLHYFHAGRPIRHALPVSSD
jgi:hypothetical protein